MTLFVLGLVVLSASLHVFWNTLVKTSADKGSFACLTCVVGVLFLLPIFVFVRLTGPTGLGTPVFLYAGLSAVFEALYVIFLFRAYDRADLSVVYPLSRGVAPILTLLLGGWVLGDWVSTRQALAVVVVVLGVLGVALSAMPGPESAGWRAGVGLSLATGGAIAGYHLVDRRVMIMAGAPHPVEYLFLMHFFQTILVALWVLLVLGRGGAIWREWRANRTGVVIVGSCTQLAYLLIIWALKFGDVTSITAGRNIGIFVSTVVGALVLKERVTPRRLAGAVVIALGVAGMVVFE